MSGMPDTDPDKPVLVLFRHDLRVADNGALSAAAKSGKPVVPVFILDEASDKMRPAGGARRWWLHHSLTALSERIGTLGARLVLRSGKTGAVVRDLVEETGADLVLWNRRYDQPSIAVDRALKADLNEAGVATRSFSGHLLHEPWELQTSTGSFYKVYTPFSRALFSRGETRAPLSAPKSLRPFEAKVTGAALGDWALLPTKPDWSGGLAETWTPGETAGHDRLARFLDDILAGYANDRDMPAREGTSRLSPYLVHGEITPFQILHALSSSDFDAPARDVEKFRNEVAWREFSWHLLHHNPDLHTVNFNDRFDGFPWREDADGLKRWQTGQTGYPFVDAGMRQLWQTGWMHNRVRMAAASFLIKHLLIDWREGEAWFWDTLVDADPANNPASWQWVAGSGADAAPYFRIFNPILQGRKFDPTGAYVRRFVPELSDVDDKTIHAPDDIAKSGAAVKLGTDYPVPVIDHGAARKRALEAFETTKETE